MSNMYDEILNNSNIQTILEYYGLKVVKNKCICPFHKDNHPSMNIHPNRGIVKCFSCSVGGNAISFIQKYENEINHNPIGVREAMQKAIEIQGLNIVIPEKNNKPLTEEQKEQLRLNNILKDAITICENNLNTSTNETIKCLNYLKSRNLSTEVIKDFHIGFNYSINSITSQLLKKYKVEDLIKVGITKKYEGKYIDVFSDRIMIPILDQYGKAIGFGGRIIDNSSKAKYINTMNTELFNKSNLLFNYHKAKSYARNDELIIVEGYMDVISAKQMKIDNVVGTMGTALTKEHIDLIKKLKCEITLCLDNDGPGKDAMIRIIPELLKENLKVSVLDISKLGNYKDFGDLQIANLTRENIYQTKISAFTFLLKYKYVKDNILTVENIYEIYHRIWKDGLLKDTKDTLIFKEFIMNNTNYKSEEIEKIINPTEVNLENRVDRYKDIIFYHYILGTLKEYAIKHQNYVLLKYVESNNLTMGVIKESLNNEQYLKDDEVTFNINAYVKEFILKSDDYISFKKDKAFILNDLLNNAQSFDSKGNIIDIKLTIEQKEQIIKQYNESFNDTIKEYIENNPDEFEEIFISNNSNQFKNLFPKSYKQEFKEQAISRYVNEGAMEAIRYALAYTDDMKNIMTRKYVNNGKYKTLLVFNNNKNILGLSAKNIKEPLKEEQNELKEDILEQKIEIKDVQKIKKSSPMSIFISLSGKEKETYKGMYLPINEETQVFIPKQLYRKDDKKIEILNSQVNEANMSEYKVDNKEHKKEYINRLTLNEFYQKYFNIYEVQMEKEVIT